MLGFGIDSLDLPALLSRVESFLSSGAPRQLITANALMLLAARENPALAEAFRAADLVVPDSAGVAMAGRWRGRPFPATIPGVELIEHLCRRAAETGRSVFFLGAAPGVAEKTAERLKEKYPALRVAGTENGYFRRETESLAILAVARAAPDLLFVALDVPRQEIWIRQNLGRLKCKIAMGVGGSFDVLSGRLKRAPRWMRIAGLEWFFRLLQEPSRAVRMSRLPEFFFRVLLDRP